MKTFVEQVSTNRKPRNEKFVNIATQFKAKVYVGQAGRQAGKQEGRQAALNCKLRLPRLRDKEKCVRAAKNIFLLSLAAAVPIFTAFLCESGGRNRVSQKLFDENFQYSFPIESSCLIWYILCDAI